MDIHNRLLNFHLFEGLSVVILSVRVRVVTGSVPGLIQDAIIIVAASIADCKVRWEQETFFWNNDEVFLLQFEDDSWLNVEQPPPHTPSVDDSDLEAMGGSLPSDLGQQGDSGFDPQAGDQDSSSVGDFTVETQLPAESRISRTTSTCDKQVLADNSATINDVAVGAATKLLGRPKIKMP